MNETINQQDEVIRTLNATLAEEHKIETETKLDDLQTSLLSVIVSLSEEMKEHINQTATNLQFDSMETLIDPTLISVTTDLRTQLSVASNEICDKIEDHERRMDSELDDLERTLSNQMNQGFTSLDCATSSELTAHNSMSIQIDDDVSDISNKIDDHDTQTAAKLMDIEEVLCRNVDCYTCGGTGGWRRAVYLNMTDLNTNCPSGWNETDYSKRTCGRATDAYYTCDSAYFPVSGGEYSQVCGKIRAYQWGGTPGFHSGYLPINEAYFTGVAVMHGSPRQHIWTFAAGAAENGDSNINQYALCPCDTSVDISIPSFVDNDYFCESGYVWPGYFDLLFVFHPDDPLWDGDGCTSNSTCCSLNNPPYFTKTLATPTTDDLELRLCCIDPSRYVDVAVELIEIYVK